MRSASYADMSKLRAVIELLLRGVSLPRELGDHPLNGEWKARRDLPIEPDWVLIYRAGAAAVCFERTGSHSDLFGK